MPMKSVLLPLHLLFPPPPAAAAARLYPLISDHSSPVFMVAADDDRYDVVYESHGTSIYSIGPTTF